MTDPTLTINNRELEVLTQFAYLGSTVTDKLSPDTEISQKVGKATTTLGRLTVRDLENAHLTTKTKIAVYQTGILNTLQYGCEAWTMYITQEKELTLIPFFSFIQQLLDYLHNKVLAIAESLNLPCPPPFLASPPAKVRTFSPNI